MLIAAVNCWSQAPEEDIIPVLKREWQERVFSKTFVTFLVLSAPGDTVSHLPFLKNCKAFLRRNAAAGFIETACRMN